MSEQDNPTTVDRRAFIGLTALAAASLSSVAARTAQAQSGRRGTPIVETTSGRIRGLRESRTFAFKGVPYGASTAGERRFRLPIKPEGWTGIRDTVEIGPRSPQYQNAVIHEFGVMNPTEPSSEDCLVLNVWSSRLDAADKRPVMVWLHGGGYSAASGGWDCYNGANLADRHDVVVVTVNHRLNLFGYLHLAQTGHPRFEETSNLGMLDIVLALQWVRDNIERFGGDPANVTVFGQSGGAGKVSTLLGMPAAKGLFHKAIVQSGAAVRSMTPDAAKRTAERFLAAFELTPATAEKILEVPYYDLRNALGRGGYAFSPVVDGATLPDHVFDPRASAISAEVPLMIGSTETEVTWGTSMQYDPLEGRALRDHVKAALGCSDAAADEAIALYRANRPDASGLDLYLILASDAGGARTGTDTQAERKAALRAAPVYKYYFEWYTPVRHGRLRCMHCLDIPFVFDNLEIARAIIGDPAAAQPAANQMAGAWAAFARSGDPNHRGIPAWPAFDSTDKGTMRLNLESRAENDPYGAEKALLARVRRSTGSEAS